MAREYFQSYKPKAETLQLLRKIIDVVDDYAAKFVEEHGEHSWEVDALPPTVLRDIIEAELDDLIDQDKVQAVKDQEALDKTRLRKALETL